MAATVKVACSIPNGIALRLTKMIDVGGGEQAFPYGDEVLLKGPATLSHGANADSRATGSSIVNDVDGDFWKQWFEQNRQGALVTSGALRHLKEDEPPVEKPENV